MKVFLSSVVLWDGGVPGIRGKGGADSEARGTPFRGLRLDPTTPQRVCLAGVRAADVVLLLIGHRYGMPQASGLSPTHEEFRDAQERATILVFVQKGLDREEPQEAFLREVQSWSSGLYSSSFTKAKDLRDAVTTALHELELARRAGPIDPTEMLSRAKAIIEGRSYGFGHATLRLVVVGGPAQQVLRPAELERPDLAREISQQALFGPSAIFETESGTKQEIRGAEGTVRVTRTSGRGQEQHRQ